MKPNFALSLSFEGIKLLHRAAGGWREVGEVPVTADDLGGELAMLRKTAASLEPGGVRTKLLIPASQIKYLTIDTAGLSEGARRKAAEAALHDATPYEVSELAYDISMDGAKTHIAAVARETLAEAEAFATEHRFHPVSFVAVPDEAPYLGEPFFGTTKGAAALLESEETVEPDGIAVVVVGAVAAEALVAAPDDEPPTAEPTPEDAENDAPAEQPSVAETSADEEPATDDEASEEAHLDTARVIAADGESEEPENPENKVLASAPETVPENQPDIVTPEPVEAAPEVEPKEEDSAQPELELQPVATPEPRTVQDAPRPVAHAEPAKPEEAANPVAPNVAAPEEKADLQKPVDPKRAALLAAASATGTAPQALEPRPFKAAPPAPDVSTPAPIAPTTGFATRRAPPPSKPVGGAQRIAVKTPKPDSSSLTKPVETPDAVTSTAAPVAAAARTIGGFLSRRKPRKAADAPIPAPKAVVPATGSEAERMTVFGARTGEVGGKPRFLGLIMTVILLGRLCSLMRGLLASSRKTKHAPPPLLLKTRSIQRSSERPMASILRKPTSPEVYRWPPLIQSSQPQKRQP